MMILEQTLSFWQKLCTASFWLQFSMVTFALWCLVAAIVVARYDKDDGIIMF